MPIPHAWLLGVFSLLCIVCKAGEDAHWDAGLFQNGKLNLSAYERESRDCSVQAINRRLGPDYEFYHKGTKPEEFPTVFMPATQSTKMGRNGKGFSYQIGTPDKAGDGTFGATCGQVFYVPDKPGDFGVDRIETYSWGTNCAVTKPEHVWWGGAHPDPALLRKDWLAGGPLGQAYNMGRGHQAWSNDALILFNSGFVGATGNQTSDDKFAHFQFPKNKIATALAVTNCNEFALVTIWDAQTGKGQVAVLALESLALKFHSWLYIGLPNGGSYTRIKLLGYIDLPGIAAPTDICAGGSNHGGFLKGNKMLSTSRLDTQEMRDSFNSGDNKHIISNAGYAVVISKHEDKVAFIDLQPLFAYYREIYLTTPENFAKTKEVGSEPKQWPYTFEVEPRQKPVVVTVQSQPKPTCVLGGLRTNGKPTNVFVASQDGRIGIYQIGGLGNDQPASAEQIKCVGAVQAGRNPTMMQFLRSSDPQVPGSSPYERNSNFVVCSRGDREIDFIAVKGSTGEVYRRIKDSRLIDPVALDVSERAYVISVADFKGRKVINYRVGPLPADHFRPQKSIGCGPEGKDDYECGGFIEFPGFVYNLSTSNVN